MASEVQINPALVTMVRDYGEFDGRGCYACGSCTVICPLTNNSGSFPRRPLRLAQVGAEKPLNGSLEPWLCYYCGECSTTCPQQTEPGESMMTLRRYLTAHYDWTGLAGKFFKSAVWEIGALVLVGVFVAFLATLFHGPVVTDRVELTTFAPVDMVHHFDLIMLFTLTFFVFSNVFRMWWSTMVRGEVKIPFLLYLTQMPKLMLHAVTQIRFRECTDKLRWIKHFLLVSGYVLMFALIVVFLEWFQTDNIYPLSHPQRWLGYYATAVLVIFTTEILIGRVKKKEQIHKYSELSDWLFPILLLLTAVTGIAVHLFRYLGLPLLTYYTYVIHMSIAVPMLVIEVPFGKWAHLYYRPLGIYFHTIKEKALQLQASKQVVPAMEVP